MVVQQIFSNNLNPSQPNLTSKFDNAVGFFISTPLNNSELEIDCFLQIYFDFPSGEIARVLPLGKIEEQVILLNKTDTETFFTIPQELVNTGHKMALLFLASNNTFLEVFIVKQQTNLLDKLEVIDNKLDLIIANCTSVETKDPIKKQQDFFFLN